MNKTLRKISAFVLMAAVLVTVAGVAPKANAAAPDSSNIKMAGNPAVYFLKNGKRYVYPNSKTYFTWYSDFNNVLTVSQSELESYPLGGNVTYRPGTRLVKITTSPKVSVVGYGRTLHAISSEAEAISLFGPNWAQMVDDLPDAFATNYINGSDKVNGMYGEGQLLKRTGDSAVVYWDGTAYRKIRNEAAFDANRFNWNYIVTAPSSWTSFSPMGSEITGVESNLVDTSGAASSSASTGSGLSVALASDTPASTSVPKGATRVNYTKFNVTASNDGDIVLQSVTVTRMGVGTPSDFENVYLYDGNTRLTTGRSINSSTNKATFNNLNMTIAKGTTKTLWIAADMSATGTGSGSSSLGIASASDVMAGGATVTGSFPVSGNMMGMTNVSGGSVTITRNGTLTNPKAGEMGAKIASFRVDAGSAEDVKMNSIALYQSGNIAADKLSNFVLKQAGTVVATASAMSNNMIVLNFTTPYLLEKGASRNFDLYADISAMARANDTINLYVDNNSDVYAVGQTYGFGVAVTRTGYDSTTPSSTTIQAGQVTLSFQGPAVKDVAVQQQDVELYRFTITAQSDIEVRNTRLNLTATNNTANSGLVNTTGTAVANYKDIKFVDVASNQIVAGPKDVSTTGSDSTQDLVYNDSWNVNAGQTRTIKVTADLANFTPAANETIRATVNAFQAGDIRNLSTNQNVSTADIVPSSAITGNAHRVQAGSLTLSLAGTPSARTNINGATGVQMTGVNIVAGTGKDVKVTSLKLTATGSSSCATETDCVLNVKLWDGTTQVGQTKSLANDNTVTFDNLNVNVTKGTTKTLVATVDLNNLGTVAGGTNLRLDVASANDLIAQDADGNSVTATGTVTGPTQIIAAAGTIAMVAGAIETGVNDSRLVVAGTTNQTLQNVRFSATNEDLRLSKLEVKITSSDDTNTASSAVNEIASVALYSGATQITDWVVPSTSGTNAIADFNSTLSDFIVNKDTSKTLSVRVNYKTVSDGARSGQELVASVDFDTNFEFRGTNSNTVLTSAGAADIAGNPVWIFKTVPTITNVALPNTTGLAAGVNTVARVSIAADAMGVVDWRRIVFTSTTSNATISAASLVDENNQAVANTTCAVTGTYVITCSSTSDQQIAAGSSKTYSLRATVAITDPAAASSVSTYIAQASSDQAQDTYANQVTAGASFIWSDESAAGHTTTSGDYNNDYKVRNLPTDPQVITRSS